MYEQKFIFNIPNTVSTFIDKQQQVKVCTINIFCICQMESTRSSYANRKKQYCLLVLRSIFCKIVECWSKIRTVQGCLVPGIFHILFHF